MATSPQVNPLLPLTDPIPFRDIRAEHVKPAVDGVLAAARKAVLEVVATQGALPDSALTYDATLGALERGTEALERVSLVCEHLESAATTPELRAVWNEAQPKISTFWSQLPLDDGLYRVLKRFAATPAAAALKAVEKRHLDKTLQEFKRHGAELPPEGCR